MTDLRKSACRFQVRRVSDSDSAVKPCPEAKPGKVDRWDVRTFKSPEEHDTKLRERWHDRGTDHQIIYGPRGDATGIRRKVGREKAWFVEFDSLADLMAFYEKYGDLVITTSWEDKETPMLEIYDGYRE